MCKFKFIIYIQLNLFQFFSELIVLIDTCLLLLYLLLLSLLSIHLNFTSKIVQSEKAL